MTTADCMEQLLRSYSGYYDISQQEREPFCAKAEFHSHNEQYILTRSARISGSDSHEYVYFACTELLTCRNLAELGREAWSRGLSNVRPLYGHRNSDITLIVIAGTMEADVSAAARKIRRYKSYCFSLCGWSSFSLIAYSVSTGNFACNSRGRCLKRHFKETFKISS